MVYDGEEIFGKKSFATQTRLPDEHRVRLIKNVLHSRLAIKVQSKKENFWNSARVYLLIDYGYIAIYLTHNFGYALNLQKAAAIKKKRCLSIKVKGARDGQYRSQISLLLGQGEVTLEFDDAEEHSKWWDALKAIKKSADVVAPKRKWATAASPDAAPTAESPHKSKVVYAHPTPDPVGFVSPPRAAAAAEVDDDANNEEDLLSPDRLSNRQTPPQRTSSTLGTPSSVKAQHKQAKTPVSRPHHRQAEELEIAPLQFDQTFEVFNPSSSQQQQQVAPPPNMDILPRTPSPTRPQDAPTPRRSDR